MTRAFRTALVDFVLRNFLWLVTVVFLLTYSFTWMEGCFHAPIRADGEGYYAYLPAYLIHGDTSFETLANLQFGGDIPAWTGILRHPVTGRYLDMYGIGVAEMMLPFFVAGHVATYMFRSPADWQKFNHPADGYSFFYQHAAGLAGVFYMILGLWLLKRLLEERFSPGVTAGALAVLIFGTNLYNYASGESVLTHPYSFFLFALLIWLTERVYRSPSEVRYYLVLGVVAGLIASVRLPNVMVLSLVPLYGISRWRHVGERWEFARANAPRILAALAVAAVVFFPQMLVWKLASGRWYVNAYQAVYPHLQLVDLRHPELFNVLFSMKGGVLFWSPALFLALAGFPAMRRYAPELILPSIAFLPAMLLLAAGWHDWTFGACFGHRGFVESLVLLAFPLASFYRQAWGSPIPALRAGVVLISIVLTGWSLFFMMLYYTRELSGYGLDSQALFDIFWWRKEMLWNAVRALR